MKILTAAQVKKLPVGTDVRLVRESTGRTGLLWVVKSGRKKMLRGVVTGHLHEIKDRQGWHYEEVDKDDKNGVGRKSGYFQINAGQDAK